MPLPGRPSVCLALCEPSHLSDNHGGLGVLDPLCPPAGLRAARAAGDTLFLGESGRREGRGERFQDLPRPKWAGTIAPLGPAADTGGPGAPPALGPGRLLPALGRGTPCWSPSAMPAASRLSARRRLPGLAQPLPPAASSTGSVLTELCGPVGCFPGEPWPTPS